VKLILQSGWLLLCLSAMPLYLCGQNQTAPATPPSAPTPTTPAVPPVAPAVQTSDTTPPSPSALPPPKYTPNYVNNGNGLSIEPTYWFPNGQPLLHTGDDNTTGLPGYLNYPGSLSRALSGNVVVPVGKGSSVRFSYFQTTKNGGTTATQDLSLFGTAINAGDPMVTSAQITNYKLSYDFVTYYWNLKGGDLRLKTLYEVQYLTVNTSIDDFQLQTNGTYNLNPASGTKSIIAPTFGFGLDQTLSKHFRWEARGSGWALPHRSKIGDTEFAIAARYGYVELVVGARAYYFRTSREADHFNDGTLYGPYAGLRLYWHKK
jgi:hypothetical protein